MASLKDIADGLRVSEALVSKVLNGRMGTSRCSRATATAIRAKARTLGYRPNASARALSKGRHNVIGAFVHRAGTLGSGLIENMLEGMADASFEANVRQTVGFFRSDAQFEKLRTTAHSGSLDGLIMAGVSHPDMVGALLRIRRSGLPMVTLYSKAIHPRLPNAGMDPCRVGFIATEHLLAQGCRRVACIHGFEPRVDGYRQALAANGLPYDGALVYGASALGFGHAIGEQAVAGLIEAGIPFDGLFAQSDVQAIGALNALARLGRRVPEDVRIVGVDNSPYCEISPVALSSVCTRLYDRGRLAVELLLKSLGGETVSSMELAPILHPRASSAVGYR